MSNTGLVFENPALYWTLSLKDMHVKTQFLAFDTHCIKNRMFKMKMRKFLLSIWKYDSIFV